MQSGREMKNKGGMKENVRVWPIIVGKGSTSIRFCEPQFSISYPEKIKRKYA